MAWTSRAVEGDMLDVVAEAMLCEAPGSFVVVVDEDADGPNDGGERFVFVVPAWGEA